MHRPASFTRHSCRLKISLSSCLNSCSGRSRLRADVIATTFVGGATFPSFRICITNTNKIQNLCRRKTNEALDAIQNTCLSATKRDEMKILIACSSATAATAAELSRKQPATGSCWTHNCRSFATFQDVVGTVGSSSFDASGGGHF